MAQEEAKKERLLKSEELLDAMTAFAEGLAPVFTIEEASIS